MYRDRCRIRASVLCLAGAMLCGASLSAENAAPAPVPRAVAGASSGSAPPAAALGASAAFYSEARSFLEVVEPIVVGEESFVSRARGLSGGGEPFGLVLSGGSARAFAHIGVLKALEDAGIHPDYIVADSMGAIVALLYGAGMAPSDIERLFEAFPPATLFEPELPLEGGALDASGFSALTRALVGDLDLADLPIPVLVLCEDLRTRRQVKLMAGDFVTALRASFALPAVFEPVPFGDTLLIDGGITALVPVEAAYRYSDRVAVATALYAKPMDFGSAFVVLNRAFDIGKTRRSVEELLAARPPVIRCDVESLSYMKFSSVREVSARGYSSAVAALDGIKPLSAPRGLPAALLERRAYYSRRIDGLVAAQARGGATPREAGVVASIDLGILDGVDGGQPYLEGYRFAGPVLRLRSGALDLDLSFLAGLDGDPGRAWAARLGLGLAGGGLGETGISFSLATQGWLLGDSSILSRVWTALDSEGGAKVLGGALADSTSAVGDAAARLAFGGASGPVFALSARASAAYALGDGLGSWCLRAGASVGDRAGGGQQATGLTLEAGAAWLLDSTGNSGPELKARTSLGLGSDLSLRLRARARGALEGTGWKGSAFPEFRGTAPASAEPLRADGGLDLVWLARALEFDVGELLIFQRPEVGVFVDAAASAGRPEAGFSGGLPGLSPAASLGLSLQFGASVMGLAPFEFTAWCGWSPLDKGFSLGLRSGRLTR